MQQADGLMTYGSIRGRIIRFALPILIGYFFQQLYNTVDSLIVGNVVGADALAAVTSTASFVYLMTGFFLGFSIGAGVIIATRIGARDEEGIKQAVHTAVALGLAMSALCTATGMLAAPLVLRATGTPAGVFDTACDYLRIYFAGAFGLVMYNMLVGILQAAGDSRHPLVYLVISSVVNILLDLLFVAGFRWGVKGAAFATVLSELLSTALVLSRLLRLKGSIALCLRSVRIHTATLKSILLQGFPTAMQGCIIDLSNVLIQSYINSFGSQAMAGLGAAGKVEGFLFLPVTAFSMALTTFISQNLGAGERERARAGMRFGLLCTVGMVELLGILYFLAAPTAIGFFNQDPDMIRYGVLRARVCAFFYFAVGFTHASSAVMRGLGKPVVPMIVMLVCWCAVRVTLLFTVGQMIHDIRLVCWVYPFTWCLSAAVYLLMFRKQDRRLHIGAAG